MPTMVREDLAAGMAALMRFSNIEIALTERWHSASRRAHAKYWSQRVAMPRCARLVLLAVVVLSFATRTCATSAQERAALEAFYYATNGAQWEANYGWMSSVDPCANPIGCSDQCNGCDGAWNGVRCNVYNNVVGLCAAAQAAPAHSGMTHPSLSLRRQSSCPPLCKGSSHTMRLGLFLAGNSPKTGSAERCRRNCLS